MKSKCNRAKFLNFIKTSITFLEIVNESDKNKQNNIVKLSLLDYLYNKIVIHKTHIESPNDMAAILSWVLL